MLQFRKVTNAYVSLRCLGGRKKTRELQRNKNELVVLALPPEPGKRPFLQIFKIPPEYFRVDKRALEEQSGKSGNCMDVRSGKRFPNKFIQNKCKSSNMVTKGAGLREKF